MALPEYERLDAADFVESKRELAAEALMQWDVRLADVPPPDNIDTELLSMAHYMFVTGYIAGRQVGRMAAHRAGQATI